VIEPSASPSSLQAGFSIKGKYFTYRFSF
jgi:hypothetical protein